MRHHKHLLSTILLLIVTGLPDVVFADSIYTFKPGALRWDDTSFVYGNNKLKLSDDFSDTGFGFDATYRINNNLALGIELLYTDKRIVQNTNLLTSLPETTPGYINVYHTTLFAKYFIGDSEAFMPYLFLGLGGSRISIHSTPNVIMHGDTYMAGFGSYIPVGKIFGLNYTLLLEYKRGYFAADNEYGFKLKNREDFLHLGIGVIY
ncbi:MAG: porin family protein [Gammaproteobacteria bacterium]|nr:porin family protein [Gammaproteobacteria bacterium]MDH5650761.1 porin family protein [Gammaproteobacteria bacterium]